MTSAWHHLQCGGAAVPVLRRERGADGAGPAPLPAWLAAEAAAAHEADAAAAAAADDDDEEEDGTRGARSCSRSDRCDSSCEAQTPSCRGFFTMRPLLEEYGAALDAAADADGAALAPAPLLLPAAQRH